MIRRYGPDDKDELTALLLEEKVKKKNMRFQENETYVFDDENRVIKGFFSIRNAWGYPELTHFVVGKPYRGGKVTRDLAVEFKRLCRIRKKRHALCGLDEKDGRLNEVVKKYFHAEHYSVNNGQKYYLMEVT